MEDHVDSVLQWMFFYFCLCLTYESCKRNFIGFGHRSRPKFYGLYACDLHILDLDKDLTTFFAG